MFVTKLIPSVSFQRYEKIFGISNPLVVRCLSNGNDGVSNWKDETGQKKYNFRRCCLQSQHRNILNDSVPYSVPHSWIHLSEKYQRKLFGRFGINCGVNPRICFNTIKDLMAQNAYKSSSESTSLPNMILNAKRIQTDLHEVNIREETITKNLNRLDQWKKELAAKIAKKEADTCAAKQRKDRLIEEVRKHFGFKVDPKEDRFKEMLEQKDREDKKKQKAEKRKVREAKVMSNLNGNHTREGQF